MSESMPNMPVKARAKASCRSLPHEDTSQHNECERENLADDVPEEPNERVLRYPPNCSYYLILSFCESDVCTNETKVFLCCVCAHEKDVHM